MITIELSAGETKLYTAPVIQGGFSDLLQLTQPRKPIATDWAEEPRLDTVRTPLQPQPDRPLRVDLWLPKGIPHSYFQRIDNMYEQYGHAYYVQIREVAEDDRFTGGSIYTLRGTIQQDATPPVAKPCELEQTQASKLYTITSERIQLANIGVTPIDGWRSALRDKTTYKETSPEATREVVLPTLMQGVAEFQILYTRDKLDELLYKETRNQLTTPYGTFACTFTRSRVREYNISGRTNYIIYDLTFALI